MRAFRTDYVINNCVINKSWNVSICEKEINIFVIIIVVNFTIIVVHF